MSHGRNSLSPALRGARVARRAAFWLLFAPIAAVALAIGAPAAFGFKSFTVMSGSMEPAIHTGDVVVEKPIAPTDARVGDVVTFKDPNDQSRLLTHRLKSMDIERGVAKMVTQGDANNAVEHWNVPVNGTIGRVQYSVPRVGYLLHHAGSRNGRLFLLVLPVLLLAAMEIFRIWRPERGPDEVLA